MKADDITMGRPNGAAPLPDLTPVQSRILERLAATRNEGQLENAGNEEMAIGVGILGLRQAGLAMNPGAKHASVMLAVVGAAYILSGVAKSLVSTQDMEDDLRKAFAEQNRQSRQDDGRAHIAESYSLALNKIREQTGVGPDNEAKLEREHNRDSLIAGTGMAFVAAGAIGLSVAAAGTLAATFAFAAIPVGILLIGGQLGMAMYRDVKRSYLDEIRKDLRNQYNHEKDIYELHREFDKVDARDPKAADKVLQGGKAAQKGGRADIDHGDVLREIEIELNKKYANTPAPAAASSPAAAKPNPFTRSPAAPAM